MLTDKRLLTVSAVCLGTAAIVIAFALAGCAPYLVGVCRHEATYCALVWAEKGPVRLARGYNHVQAQALIYGKWEWLHMHGERVEVTYQDDFKPLRFNNLEDYFWYLERLARQIREDEEG
jgi:hypothetical protein